MIKDKFPISRKILLVISSVISFVFVGVALSSILNAELLNGGGDYRFLIIAGLACNLVAGVAGLISIAFVCKSRDDLMLRIARPLISLAVIPDFVSIYLNGVKNQSGWMGLLTTFLMIAFVYFSILWEIEIVQGGQGSMIRNFDKN